jgi:excisionase family DNA binding protein
MTRPEILSIAEVSVYIGTPVSTLYQWRSRSEGPPSMKVGRHVRYRREAIDAWLLRLERSP